MVYSPPFEVAASVDYYFIITDNLGGFIKLPISSIYPLIDKLIALHKTEPFNSDARPE